MEASPTPPAASAAKRIGAGEVVSETFAVYRENFGALFGSALAVFVVVGVIAGIVQTGDSVVLGLIAAVIRLAGHALYTGFVVRLVQDVRDGRRDETVGDLFEAAMPAIVALIVFGVLFGIAVGIGFVFLIVPGLILLTFWSVGAPAIVVEGIGPIEAFGRSWRLVRGNAWSVFGALLLIFLIVLVIQFVISAIATPIADVALVIAVVLGAALTAPIYSLAVSILYFDLGGGDRAAPAAAAQPGTPPPPPPPPPSA
jgi:hypothetical protein